tara:strand:- start:506 stop:1060 length:555 start_codon:yes stop_codon:yes gene_type:complete
MDLTKYKWKCRILLLNTTCYRDSNYKKSKELYQKYIKDFHKRHIKLMSNRKKGLKFSIKLIGYDGTLKKEFDTLVPQDIFYLIDSMPMSKEFKSGKIQPLNLSLYSDYKPETTLKGLGFKNKEKAIYTLEAIRGRDTKYQVNVVSTMLGRAKKHPSKTTDMEDAIIVFENWLMDYKKSKNIDKL